MIDPDDVIAQADLLAGTFDQDANPTDADLRRAASTAYDALFHAITGELVSAIDPGLAEVDSAGWRRYFSHRSLKKVLTWVDQGGPANVVGAQALARLAATDQGLVNAASVFTTLQERRHLADYDHSAGLTAVDVKGLISDADQAVGDVVAASGTSAMRAVAAISLMYGK